MFILSAQGKRGRMSVAAESATAALDKVRELKTNGFASMVYDQTGHQVTLEELQDFALTDGAAELIPAAAVLP